MLLHNYLHNMKICIINGPNLNLLGRREPHIYGTRSFDDFFGELQQRYPQIELTYFQSNHEGALIDRIQQEGFSSDGIVLNAAGYSHTSIALRDAVSAIQAPVVEVHISDISRRETFRHHSYLTDVCQTSFVGHGLEGYALAIDFLKEACSRLTNDRH